MVDLGGKGVYCCCRKIYLATILPAELDPINGFLFAVFKFMTGRLQGRGRFPKGCKLQRDDKRSLCRHQQYPAKRSEPHSLPSFTKLSTQRILTLLSNSAFSYHSTSLSRLTPSHGFGPDILDGA